MVLTALSFFAWALTVTVIFSGMVECVADHIQSGPVNFGSRSSSSGLLLNQLQELLVRFQKICGGNDTANGSFIGYYWKAINAFRKHLCDGVADGSATSNRIWGSGHDLI